MPDDYQSQLILEEPKYDQSFDESFAEHNSLLAIAFPDDDCVFDL